MADGQKKDKVEKDAIKQFHKCIGGCWDWYNKLTKFGHSQGENVETPRSTIVFTCEGFLTG